MGMLFARRRTKKVEGLTTTENLLQKEQKKVENDKPQVAKTVPAKQPKFKV